MNSAAKLDRQLSQILEQVRIRAGSLSTGSRIIIEKWVLKLMEQQSHLEWKKNRNLYGVYLLDMLMKRTLDDPFNKRPPDTALPTLPSHIKQYYGRMTSEILTRSIDETGLDHAVGKSGMGKSVLRASSTSSVGKLGFKNSAVNNTPTSNDSRLRSLSNASKVLTSATAIYTPHSSNHPSAPNLNADFGLSKPSAPSTASLTDNYPPDPVGALLRRIYNPAPVHAEGIHHENNEYQQHSAMQGAPLLSSLDTLATAPHSDQVEHQLTASKLRIQELESEILNYKNEITSLKRVIEALKAEDFALEKTARQIHAEALSIVSM